MQSERVACCSLLHKLNRYFICHAIWIASAVFHSIVFCPRVSLFHSPHSDNGRARTPTRIYKIFHSTQMLMYGALTTAMMKGWNSMNELGNSFVLWMKYQKRRESIKYVQNISCYIISCLKIDTYRWHKIFIASIILDFVVEKLFLLFLISLRWFTKTYMQIWLFLIYVYS